MTSRYSKRAVKRDPDAAPGTPALLYWIDCECGRCVPTPINGPALVPCDCGIVYDTFGWIVRRAS